MNRPELECTKQSCIYSQQNCNSPRDSSYNKPCFANSCATDAPKKKRANGKAKMGQIGNGKLIKKNKNRKEWTIVAKSLKVKMKE